MLTEEDHRAHAQKYLRDIEAALTRAAEHRPGEYTPRKNIKVMKEAAAALRGWLKLHGERDWLRLLGEEEQDAHV